MRRATALTVFACLALPVSCLDHLRDAQPLAELDEPFFRCRVQPVLTKNCAALLCHGDDRRFLRLYARNRLRLGGTEAERNALLRDSERAFNFASARGFVEPGSVEQSLLLQKPLEQNAGGFYHGGAVEYGRGDVFLDREDPDFRVLADWVQGATEDPTCVEPGSDL